MMKRTSIFTLFILLILSFFCSVIVKQGTYALKFNTFAHTTTPKLLGPGLHFKIPLFNSITEGYTQPIQPKYLQANGATETPYLSIETFDKHTIALGYGVLLQVTDPILFNQKKDQNIFLKDLRIQLNQALSTAIAEQTLIQLLQANNQQMINRTVIATLNQSIKPSGVKILNLYFTSMNVADFERTAWITRMKTEQDAELTLLEKQTSTLSQSLRAETDNKIATVLSQGLEQANKIHTAGALSANKIYTDAYNQDPAFYEFFQSLQAYKKVLTSKQDVLVLSTHTPFFSALANTNVSTKSTARS